MATIEHSLIVDPFIHEPKGVAAADDGQIYVADGAGSGAWTDPDDLGLTISNSFTSDLELVKAEGTTVSGTGWADRSSDIAWTESANNITSASVSTNNISLPAGTYTVEASASFTLDGTTRRKVECLLRLRDITSSATLVVGLPIRLVSLPESSGGVISLSTGETAVLKGRFTIGSTKTVRLQYYSNNTAYASQSLSESGETPNTSFIRFWKIA